LSSRKRQLSIIIVIVTRLFRRNRQNLCNDGKTLILAPEPMHIHLHSQHFLHQVVLGLILSQPRGIHLDFHEHCPLRVRGCLERFPRNGFRNSRLCHDIRPLFYKIFQKKFPEKFPQKKSEKKNLQKNLGKYSGKNLGKYFRKFFSAGKLSV
jgi:hypothetical protein